MRAKASKPNESRDLSGSLRADTSVRQVLERNEQTGTTEVGTIRVPRIPQTGPFITDDPHICIPSITEQYYSHNKFNTWGWGRRDVSGYGGGCYVLAWTRFIFPTGYIASALSRQTISFVLHKSPPPFPQPIPTPPPTTQPPLHFSPPIHICMFTYERERFAYARDGPRHRRDYL